MKCLKHNNVLGEDELQADIHKHASDVIGPRLEQIFGSRAGGHESIVPPAILQKGDQMNRGNYRGMRLVLVSQNLDVDADWMSHLRSHSNAEYGLALQPVARKESCYDIF